MCTATWASVAVAPRINGRIAPLTQRLHSGDVVEIITGKQAAPSRDWLNASSGYLKSSRSKSKLRAYFRRVDAAASQAPPRPHRPAAAPPERPPEPPRAIQPRKTRSSGKSPVEIDGVGDLPITLARCCAPVRPQPIRGYLTLGRGVTIHLADCAGLARMVRQKPQRLLQVEWADGDSARIGARIQIEAFDRRGLLRDISDLIAEEHVSIEGVSSHTDPDDRIAHFEVRLTIRDASGTGEAAAQARARAQCLQGQARALNLAVEGIDRPLVGGQRSLVHGLGQRGMRVHRALQILAAGVVFQRQHGLGQQLAGHGADDVHAQHAVAVGIRDDLHEARGGFHRSRTATGNERETADLHIDAGGAGLRLGLAHPGDFRRRVDHRRNCFVVHVAVPAGDQVGGHHAFVLGLVRQHRAAHAVADGEDIGRARAAMLVHHDEAARVDLDARAFAEQILRVGAAPHRHHQAVEAWRSARPARR